MEVSVKMVTIKSFVPPQGPIFCVVERRIINKIIAVGRTFSSIDHMLTFKKAIKD